MSEPSQRNLMLRGLLQKRESDLRDLTYRIQGIIRSINTVTFLTDNRNPWGIDGQQVISYARELDGCLREGVGLRETIANLKAELGE